MGYTEITLPLPTDYREEDLSQGIKTFLGISDFSFQIDQKSLDARKKSHIHWLLRVTVMSPELPGPDREPDPALEIPYQKRDKKILVVGSGPAGFFAAYVLQTAGFDVTIIERGAGVVRRDAAIRAFEDTGKFDPLGTYAFGEGGAGTFSDGKLTSRTKTISLQKQFVLASYVAAGAPEEIRFLAHPHLGSDTLKTVVKRLRQAFIAQGGILLFETFLEDLTVQNQRITTAVTSAGVMDADYFILAPGHSAHETFRMLMGRDVLFRTKSFAIGCRVEHPQALINQAQWGRTELPGLKAAEYRLTAKNPGLLPAYTFCMCPGGVVVPATPYKNTNIVNGMSRYRRNGNFANAACVAAVDLSRLLSREVSPPEALDWLGRLKNRFFEAAGGYQAPFITIREFINRKTAAHSMTKSPESSYPLGLIPMPLWELLPDEIEQAIRAGLKEFSRKLKGFDTGIIMGLESKTSSPIQAIRDDRRRCAGFDNLFLAGEGSGHSGGIISSAADGISAALSIMELSHH